MGQFVITGQRECKPWLEIIRAHQFVGFSLVGGLGFCVDAGLLLLLMALLDLDILIARGISVLSALITTWGLNRTLTFRATRSSRRLPELLRYLAIGAAGGLINYLVFSGLILLAIRPFNLPLVALSIGAIAALLFNFASSRTYVFKGRS